MVITNPDSCWSDKSKVFKQSKKISVVMPKNCIFVSQLKIFFGNSKFWYKYYTTQFIQSVTFLNQTRFIAKLISFGLWSSIFDTIEWNNVCIRISRLVRTHAILFLKKCRKESIPSHSMSDPTLFDIFLKKYFGVGPNYPWNWLNF